MRTPTFDKLDPAKQTAILDAAARVFAQKGYFQAGINEICKAARISNGALYKYFKNKQGLFYAVANQTMALMSDQAKALETENTDIWEQFRRLLDRVLPFTSRYRDYFIVYMDLGSPSMDAFASELSDTFERQSFEYIFELLETARQRGELRENVSPDTAAYLIDNHLMLFAFSCVSEHYDRRFQQYFGKSTGQLGPQDKIEQILRSFHQLLG